MESGRNLALCSGSRRKCDRHRTRVVDFGIIEVAARAFGQNCRCKGHPEIAMLYATIQPVCHREIGSIRKNGPVAECTRSEFHAACESAHHAALSQALCNISDAILDL